MGVVNVTPDSFSDGGRFADHQDAIEYGIDLYQRGADMIDVGGESTRPGAVRVNAQDETARVIPVVAGLTAAGIPVSVDTTRAAVAEVAIDAGASIVNDVSGGLVDPELLDVVADRDVDVVLMHWRAPSDVMDQFANYNNVVTDVIAELIKRRDAALAAGIAAQRIILDPGLGFAKRTEHNWQLLQQLPQLVGVGHRVLIGASRKRFIGALLTDQDGVPVAVDQRDVATHAISALAAANGAWALRVHEVAGTLDAVKVAAAWTRAGAVQEGKR
jgi:dihydropteroate synthase